MTTLSTRLKDYVSHRVSGPRLRQVLLDVYGRSQEVRHVARRAQARLRRAVRQAGRELLVATGRLRRTGVFVVVSLDRPGGQSSSALIPSVNTAVAAGLPVEVLLVDYDQSLDGQFAANVEQGEIASGVRLRRFWREAVPGAGTAEPRHTTEGLVAEPAPGAQPGEWRTAFYRCGIPVLAIDERPAGRTIEYFGAMGKPIRRDEIDADGNLVRIIDVHPETGREVTHRYPMGANTCWLSVWANPQDGSLQSAYQHLPTPRTFVSLRAVQAQWVDQIVAGTARPIVVAASPESRDVVRGSGHRGTIRRTLVGDVSSGQWQAVRRGSGTGAVERGTSLQSIP